jgi:hypothetical protein
MIELRRTLSVRAYSEARILLGNIRVHMKSPLNIVAAIGLALGGIFGMLGTIATRPNLRASSWAIDSVGLIVATSLLTLKWFRKGNDFLGSGFPVFAIGEAVMLSGTAATLEASVPAFAAGTAFWSAALLLISVPSGFAIWVRFAGIIASVLFAITAAMIFWGGARVANLLPLAILCLPVSGSHLCRLDLDAAQSRLKRQRCL